MVSVALKQVSKSFGAVDVIKDVDLDIGHGEFTVFVGPSGCGKSTLLRLIAGLEEMTSGELRIDGALMNDVEPAARGVAMVFQSYALYPHMTVAQNMSFGLRMTGMAKPAVAKRVADAARILQLTPMMNRKPSQLSGGQRQRVAIGRAIVRDPKVFLFDEPLSNLDAELRVAMRVEIAKLHQTLGNTMIYVTHDQTEAMTLADKIVVLRDGRISQVGSPLQLYEDPDNQFVAGFIGSPKMNFLEAVAAGDSSSPVVVFEDVPFRGLKSLQSWPTPTSKVTLGIRPEHFIPAAEAPAQMPMQVDIVEKLGGTNFVYGRTLAGAPFVVELRTGTLPHPGEVFPAGFNPGSLRLFDAQGLRLR